MPIGLIGLGGTFILNLFGLPAPHHVGAHFFSPRWWQVWTPNWIVWFTITVIGYGFPAKRPSTR
jgi:hypothetical protein